VSHVAPNVAPNFRVISADDHGKAVRCSYCARGMKRVVVLPPTDRPELEVRIKGANGEELWVGLCAYCVLAMANALAAAEGIKP
jgi:hypothetical protein